MKLRLASPTTFDSIVDGPGLRMVIWTQGCIHNCTGCHNPQTHSLNSGYKIDVNEIIDIIRNLKLQKGITLSGGEPFLQSEVLELIAKEAKRNKLDVWAYTGFTFEELLEPENKDYNDRIKLLNQIAVLVDGKLELSKRDISLKFRGSYNQRIIDVQRSLKENDIILKYEYMNKVLSIAK